MSKPIWYTYAHRRVSFSKFTDLLYKVYGTGMYRNDWGGSWRFQARIAPRLPKPGFTLELIYNGSGLTTPDCWEYNEHLLKFDSTDKERCKQVGALAQAILLNEYETIGVIVGGEDRGEWQPSPATLQQSQEVGGSILPPTYQPKVMCFCPYCGHSYHSGHKCYDTECNCDERVKLSNLRTTSSTQLPPFFEITEIHSMNVSDPTTYRGVVSGLIFFFAYSSNIYRLQLREKIGVLPIFSTWDKIIYDERDWMPEEKVREIIFDCYKFWLRREDELTTNQVYQESWASWIRAFQIFARYCENGEAWDRIGAAHDLIYVRPDFNKELEAQDKARLEELGWSYDVDLAAWVNNV